MFPALFVHLVLSFFFLYPCFHAEAHRNAHRWRTFFPGGGVDRRPTSTSRVGVSDLPARPSRPALLFALVSRPLLCCPADAAWATTLRPGTLSLFQVHPQRLPLGRSHRQLLLQFRCLPAGVVGLAQTLVRATASQANGIPGCARIRRTGIRGGGLVHQEGVEGSFTMASAPALLRRSPPKAQQASPRLKFNFTIHISHQVQIKHFL